MFVVLYLFISFAYFFPLGCLLFSYFRCVCVCGCKHTCVYVLYSFSIICIKKSLILWFCFLFLLGVFEEPIFLIFMQSDIPVFPLLVWAFFCYLFKRKSLEGSLQDEGEGRSLDDSWGNPQFRLDNSKEKRKWSDSRGGFVGKLLIHCKNSRTAVNSRENKKVV